MALIRKQLESIYKDAEDVIDYCVTHPKAFILKLKKNPVDVLEKYGEFFDFYCMKKDYPHYYDYEPSLAE
jgi:hypothetical protein